MTAFALASVYDDPNRLTEHVAGIAAEHMALCLKRGMTLSEIVTSLGMAHYSRVDGKVALVAIETAWLQAVQRAGRLPGADDEV